MRLFIILDTLNTMMAAGTDAFGVHGLQGKMSDHYLSAWEKATTYQVYRGLVLLVIGATGGTISISVDWTGWSIFTGIVFFSESLYILVLAQIKVLGVITPTGGVLFTIGWIMLIVVAFKFAGQILKLQTTYVTKY